MFLKFNEVYSTVKNRLSAFFNVCHSGGTALRFHGNNIEQYGIFNGSTKSLFNFTVSVWVNPEHSNAMEILSYAYDNVQNGLLISFQEGKLVVIFTPKSKKNQERIERY